METSLSACHNATVHPKRDNPEVMVCDVCGGDCDIAGGASKPMVDDTEEKVEEGTGTQEGTGGDSTEGEGQGASQDTDTDTEEGDGGGEAAAE